MNLWQVGSWVMIGDGIPAQVKQICIGETGVEYECVWWEMRTRKCEWLSALELKQHPDCKATEVGFHTSLENS